MLTSIECFEQYPPRKPPNRYTDTRRKLNLVVIMVYRGLSWFLRYFLPTRPLQYVVRVWPSDTMYLIQTNFPTKSCQYSNNHCEWKNTVLEVRIETLCQHSYTTHTYIHQCSPSKHPLCILVPHIWGRLVGCIGMHTHSQRVNMDWNHLTSKTLCSLRSYIHTYMSPWRTRWSTTPCYNLYGVRQNYIHMRK